MRKSKAILALALFFALIVTIPTFHASSLDDFPWKAPVPGTGTPVTTPVLKSGYEYTITAAGIWWWGKGPADAQYYSTIQGSNWIWGNHFQAPDGSFLQIDGQPVNWGPFFNGQPDGSGHEYTITYIGDGNPITLQVVDSVDYSYEGNGCKIYVVIVEGPPPPPPPEAETAYAYGGDYATCFKYWGFKNWGWSNGPLGPDYYEFDIYAGAAKCNINKGTLVGTLTIDYDGSTATVTYMMDAGWTMQTTQLYVGSEPLPRDSNGDYTVAPGQYTEIHAGINTPTDTYTMSGLSGNIYVVAHADVLEI